jgi:hypothetical protein
MENSTPHPGIINRDPRFMLVFEILGERASAFVDFFQKIGNRGKPPPSESLCGLFCALAFRHFTSVNGMLVSRFRHR